MSTPEKPLSPAQCDEFDRRGLLVIDSGIPEPLLDSIVDGLQGKFDGNHVSNGVVYAPNRIQDAWHEHDAVRQLATHPPLLAALAQIYGRRPLPFQTLNFQYGTEQRAHSDTIHFNSQPSGYMCGVWVALEDISPTQGPLVYYPGSHRLPEVTLDNLGEGVIRLQHQRAPLGKLRRRLRRLGTRLRGRKPAPTPSVYEEIYTPHYEPHIEQLIAGRGLSPEYGTIRKGQAIIWAANLLHGGSPHLDRGRTRLSQVTHYFFDGCRYYTPLMQTRSGIAGRPLTFWRNPDWIPLTPPGAPA